MITSQFHLYPAAQINFILLLIPFTGKDELNKLVCSKHISLHNSVGRTQPRSQGLFPPPSQGKDPGNEVG